MCSTSKEYCYMYVSKLHDLDRTTETSSTVTCAISTDMNCWDCYYKDIEVESQTSVVDKSNQLPAEYLDQHIFKLLIPTLERTLIEASKWNALRVQKCRFNGLDYIAEVLWNCNPQRSKTFTKRLNVYNIPQFKEYLRQHPRPYYPKSWLWSENEAALHIQRFTRGWIVRKRADVQEMRQFWKDIAVRNHTDKKTLCIVQSQGVSRRTQDSTEHDITDEKLDHCKKYRLRTHMPKTIPKSEPSML